jgi:hypothetical protein
MASAAPEASKPGKAGVLDRLCGALRRPPEGRNGIGGSFGVGNVRAPCHGASEAGSPSATGSSNNRRRRCSSY